jgi:hypothetical protein
MGSVVGGLSSRFGTKMNNNLNRKDSYRSDWGGKS